MLIEYDTVFRCFSAVTQHLIGVGCPLCKNGLDRFGYRDVLLLRQFLTPDGYIIGRRKTGTYIYSYGDLLPCKHMHKIITFVSHTSVVSCTKSKVTIESGYQVHIRYLAHTAY